MLRQYFPALWFVLLRFGSGFCGGICRGFARGLCGFSGAFLVFSAFVFAAVGFVHEVFFTRFVVGNQLVSTVADEFLPPHCGDGFAQ